MSNALVPLAITPAEGSPRTETLLMREVDPQSWGRNQLLKVFAFALLRLDGPRSYTVTRENDGTGKNLQTTTITIETTAGTVAIGPLPLVKGAVDDALRHLDEEVARLHVIST